MNGELFNVKIFWYKEKNISKNALFCIVLCILQVIDGQDNDSISMIKRTQFVVKRINPS